MTTRAARRFFFWHPLAPAGILVPAMHAPHVPSTTYRHKTLQDHAFADGKQLPNRFFLGDNRKNPTTGAEEVSVWQEEQVDPAPTWWAIATFNETFEKIPLVG